MRTRNVTHITVLAGLLALSPALVQAQPVVDGTVDNIYGGAKATDKSGDGNGKGEMDLRKLYLKADATHLYIAFTITADITTATSNWGKYIVYIDSTNDTKGATSDAWTRNVTVSDPHKPEYSINTWVDQAPYGASRVELWGWSGTAWAKSSTGVAAAALKGGTGGSVIEYKVALSALGSPKKIWVEVWSTGNGATDNAQDTINAPAEDWNATTWTAKSTLSVSTPLTLTSQPSDAGVDTTPTVDAGPAPDTTPTPDSTPAIDSTPAADSASATDSAPATDSTPITDSAPAADSAPTTDSAPGSDAAPAADQGVQADGAPATDATGSDSGSVDVPQQEEGCACGANGSLNAGQLPLSLAVVGLFFLRRRRQH
jgi:hypothetical protein